jgi:hypothetical protein
MASIVTEAAPTHLTPLLLTVMAGLLARLLGGERVFPVLMPTR